MLCRRQPANLNNELYPKVPFGKQTLLGHNCAVEVSTGASTAPHCEALAGSTINLSLLITAVRTQQGKCQVPCSLLWGPGT
jgi:hypothetical protein